MVIFYLQLYWDICTPVRVCMGRSEDDLWELALSLHHAVLRH